MSRATPEEHDNIRQDKDTETVMGQIQSNVEDALEHAREDVSRSRAPWYQVSRRTTLLIVTYLSLLIVFVFLAFFVQANPVIPFEVAVSRGIQQIRSPWFDAFMIGVSYLGNQWLIFIALITFTALSYWLVRLRVEALFIICQSAISFVLTEGMKRLIARPRPTGDHVTIIEPALGLSFPSGHVMSYIAFWGLIFSFSLILFKGNRWWHYVLLVISGSFLLLVGLSRMYLGDHWLSDVLGGYILGGLLLGISLTIYLRVKPRSRL